MEFSRILVDTDVIIDFLRRKEQAKILLEKAASTADLFLSVVSLAELLAGMRPREERETEALVAGFNLIPVTEKIARKAGEFRRHSKKILLPDCLIAATAVEEDCLLLTGNQKDYPFDALKFFRVSLL